MFINNQTMKFVFCILIDNATTFVLIAFIRIIYYVHFFKIVIIIKVV